MKFKPNHALARSAIRKVRAVGDAAAALVAEIEAAALTKETEARFDTALAAARAMQKGGHLIPESIAALDIVEKNATKARKLYHVSEAHRRRGLN